MSRVSHRSVVTGRSPLHSSALRLKDMTVGRTVILLNTETGIRKSYRVLSLPYVGLSLEQQGYRGMHQRIVIDLLSLRTGLRFTTALADMGVSPYSQAQRGGWNLTSFTVDARKAYLLPESDRPAGRRENPSYFDLFDTEGNFDPALC